MIRLLDKLMYAFGTCQHKALVSLLPQTFSIGQSDNKIGKQKQNAFKQESQKVKPSSRFYLFLYLNIIQQVSLDLFQPSTRQQLQVAT